MCAGLFFVDVSPKSALQKGHDRGLHVMKVVDSSVSRIESDIMSLYYTYMFGGFIS